MLDLRDKQLEYITEHIPYYFKFEKAKWNELPIVSKLQIRERYQDFIDVRMEKSKREQTLQALNDRALVGKTSYNDICRIDDLIIEETTGTSGQPFRVVKTMAERCKMGKILWEYRKKIDPQVNINNFYLFNHTSIGKVNPNAYNYEINHILEIYNDVLEKKASWIHTSVVPLMKHIEILKTSNTKFEFPDIKYIELTGNFVTEEEVAVIENFFQAKVISFYGCIEAWAIAYPNYDDNLHICKDNVLVEIINDEGKIIESFDEVGHIVITTLCNRVMPLIRYDTGDIGKYVNFSGDSESKDIIELQEGREINYIKGLKEKKLGTKQFGNILTYVRKEKDLSDLRYIQFIQTKENEFEVYMNKLIDQEEVSRIITEITCQRLGKKVNLRYIYMTEDDINRRKYEKPQLFICKY